MNEDRISRMRAALEKALAPVALEIRDDSHKHIGHEGARDGRGHFHCTIASEAFRGKSPLDRHRMVYDALGEMMLTDIHALSIHTMTPDELQTKPQ